MSTGSISRESLMIIRCFSLRPAEEAVVRVSLISDSFLVTWTSGARGQWMMASSWLHTLLSCAPSSIRHLTSWIDFFLVTVMPPPLSLMVLFSMSHQRHENIRISPVKWDHVCQSVLFWRYFFSPPSQAVTGAGTESQLGSNVCLSHGGSHNGQLPAITRVLQIWHKDHIVGFILQIGGPLSCVGNGFEVAFDDTKPCALWMCMKAPAACLADLD